jgi:hypothetical protein
LFNDDAARSPSFLTLFMAAVICSPIVSVCGPIFCVSSSIFRIASR